MANGYKPVARNFINFDQYLAQNDPSKLVEDTTSGLAKRGGQLQSDIGAAQTGFTQKALAGAGGQVSNPLLGGIRATPTAINSEDEAKRIAGLNYTGPRSLAESMGRDVSNDVGDVASRARALGTAEGRTATLLDQQKNQPGYTRGMAQWDAALLGSSNKTQDVSQRYAGLDKYLSDAQAQTGKTVAAVEGALGERKKFASDLLGKNAAEAQRVADRNKEVQDKFATDQAAHLAKTAEANANLARWAGGNQRIDDKEAVNAWLASPEYGARKDKATFGKDFEDWYTKRKAGAGPTRPELWATPGWSNTL